MEREKWLHIGADEGEIKLPHRPHRSLHLGGKRIKIVQSVAAALLFCFLFSLHFDHTLFFVRHRNWIEDAASGIGHDGDEMICNFNEIIPSEKLQWHPCFNIAQCARLTVPMDYNRPLNASKDNPKVHIALAMIPGVNHTKTGRYSAAPLLINPGGPGGQGAPFAIGISDTLQRVVSSDRSQDIIGFDPRGIGATMPQANCWASPSNGTELTEEEVKEGAYNSMIWFLLGSNLPLVGDTEHALSERDARARAAAKLCKQQDDFMGEDSILRHVSTPAVARDMLSIIDAWDEWRAETGQIDAEAIPPTSDDEVSNGKSSNLDLKGRLVYWGFSYGTLLGATFAAMFPQRVGRVLLDGVVDADYYVSEIWADSLRDTDGVEETFYKYCHQAGQECALYRHNDTSADIKYRVQNVFDSLREQPFHGISPYQLIPFTFTASLLKNFFFSTLYVPNFAFPVIATLLDAFNRSDDQAITYLISLYYPPLSQWCDESRPFSWPSVDAQLAVMCTDKRYPLNESVSELKKQFEVLTNTSHYADVWMSLMIGCNSYDIQPTDPPMRWDDHPSHREDPINTSFPLMFLSNTLDPVTPLFAGVKMAKKFAKAGLLEVEAEGHCSLASLSRCTMKTVRDYFEKGWLPDIPEWGPEGKEVEEGSWSRCEADEWPWRPFDGEAWMERVQMGWRERETRGEVTSLEVKALLQEGLEALQLMEAWREVQRFARGHLVPRGLHGAPRPWPQ